jgi:tetratricopeptide (TPR) repeat protein
MLKAFQPDIGIVRRVFEEGLARRQREFGDADLRTAQAARDLGLFLERVGDTAGARRALQQAIRIDEKAAGPEAQATLQDVGDLAAISPPALATPLLLRASKSSDPTVAGPALSALANIRKAAGDPTGATVLLRRAVTQAEAVDGKDGPMVALVLNSLAAAAEPEEAVAALRRAVDIDRRAFGPKHARTLQDARTLANLLRRLGRTAEAATLEHEFTSALSH